MRLKRHSEITIDTHEITVIRSRRRAAVYCERCRAEVLVNGSEPTAITSGNETVDGLIPEKQINTEEL